MENNEETVERVLVAATEVGLGDSDVSWTAWNLQQRGADA